MRHFDDKKLAILMGSELAIRDVAPGLDPPRGCIPDPDVVTGCGLTRNQHIPPLLPGSCCGAVKTPGRIFQSPHRIGNRSC